MKYFIDIDNTICITSNLNDYNNSVPIDERIKKVNELYEQGNNITYWTARGSSSGYDYKELTINQLDKWGCKYHEILFNKPSYDLYIDDKSRFVDTFWPINTTVNKCDCDCLSINNLDKEKSMFTKKNTSEKVEKGWGHEIIFVNNQKYCGKILHFNKGAKFSMHFHILKQETWFISSGKFILKWIDTTNANIIEEELNIGHVVTNLIGEPHQIICLEEGDIFEVSTQHFDNDSYRVFKGDSQIN
jgi:mannose-6-phosphate isomerase-like protein (cupin superfamily)